MADRFGVDAQVAAEMGRHLAEIRASFNDLRSSFEGGVTGSARVQGALDHFVSESSDVRDKLDKELERASGMLTGLATGATELDGALAEAVTVEDAPAPGPQTTPSPQAAPSPQGAPA
jgi:hypothetical protein